MNLSNIGGALSRVGTATLRTLEHHAPKILMAIGIGCGYYQKAEILYL